MPTIWQVLFQRLQTGKTPKFCRGFVVFLSVLVAKRGAEAAISTMTTIQAGIHEMILSNIFAVESLKVAKEEKKLVAAAGARFLCETDLLNTNAQCWRDVCAASAKCADAYVSQDQDGKHQTVPLTPHQISPMTSTSRTKFGKDRAARGLFRHLFSTLRRENQRHARRRRRFARRRSGYRNIFRSIMAQCAQKFQETSEIHVVVARWGRAKLRPRCFQKIGFAL